MRLSNETLSKRKIGKILIYQINFTKYCLMTKTPFDNDQGKGK